VLHHILANASPILSLAVAPAGFGSFGDHLIAAQYAPSELLAIDAGNTNTVTAFATSTGISGVEFGPDGTLYVSEFGATQISTVTADGVFELFYDTPGKPMGIAVATDGSRMFFAHQGGYYGDGWLGTLDELSLPDKVLTHHMTLEVGGTPFGMVVDGSERLLFSRWLDGQNAIDMIPTP
jgi:DNA-binding beta-propeller fold protein YncE